MSHQFEKCLPHSQGDGWDCAENTDKLIATSVMKDSPENTQKRPTQSHLVMILREGHDSVHGL